MPTLRDLGLSEYEDRVYRSLLQTGATTAKELSRTSEVPMGRIYDVLNSLEQHSLVRSQASGRPKKYVAVEPDVALDRLLEAKKRELDEQADRYEEIVDTLVDEIDTGEPVDDTFWTAAVGSEETLELLLERISAAEEELIYVAGSSASGIDLRSVTDRVTDELEGALERGVDIDLLLKPALVAELPVEKHPAVPRALPAVRELRGPDARVGRRNVCAPGWGRNLHRRSPNPLDPTESFAMINLQRYNVRHRYTGGVRPAVGPCGLVRPLTASLLLRRSGLAVEFGPQLAEGDLALGVSVVLVDRLVVGLFDVDDCRVVEVVELLDGSLGERAHAVLDELGI